MRRRFMWGAAIFAILFAPVALASDSNDDVSLTISADYVTEYVLRGVTLQGDAFQPGIEGIYGPWRAGVWASFANGKESDAFADEIDFYLGLGWELGDVIDGEIGATLYHYPQSGGVFDIGEDKARTVEFYGGLDFDTLLSPRLTAYYDMHRETVTLEAELSHPIVTIDRFTLKLR